MIFVNELNEWPFTKGLEINHWQFRFSDESPRFSKLSNSAAEPLNLGDFSGSAAESLNFPRFSGSAAEFTT